MERPWFIKDAAFVERLSREDMAVFRRVCPDRRYARGERIFHAGDPATDLHLVAQGQVKLVRPLANGNEHIAALCGPGDFIGESFLLEAARYRVDALALTEVVTCPVDRSQFLQLTLQAPALILAFAQVLAGHLGACREQLSASYAPVKARVLRVLWEQAERFGRPGEDGWLELSTQLKHEELAAMVTATRVSVSMAMAELREEGLLEGTRGEYRLNVGALQQAARA